MINKLKLIGTKLKDSYRESNSNTPMPATRGYQKVKRLNNRLR